MPLLALGVVCKLNEPQVELGDALLGARLLLVERLAGDHEAVQCRRRLGLGVAQRRHGGGGIRLEVRTHLQDDVEVTVQRRGKRRGR